MEESTIKNILFKDLHSKKVFVGVYSRTRIPLNSKTNAGYIINLDDFGSRGFHWIGVFITRNKIIIFDSFGGNFLNDPLFGSFIEYHKNGRRKIVSSPYVIQNFANSTCGLYCTLFILMLSRGYAFEDFVGMFNKNNSLDNDAAITNYFKCKYNIKLIVL